MGTSSSLLNAVRAAGGQHGIPANDVGRLSEPGSEGAKNGVSIAEMIQRAVAESMAAMIQGGGLPTPTPTVSQVNAPQNGKVGKVAAASKANAPQSAKPAGPWYVKPCDRWGIDARDAMVNDHLLVTRNPEPKYGKVFMLVRGKSKPVCFSAESFGNLVASCGLLGKFAKDYASYLTAEDTDTQ